MVQSPELDEVLKNMLRFGDLSLSCYGGSGWYFSCAVELNAGGRVIIDNSGGDNETPIQAVLEVARRLESLAKRINSQWEEEEEPLR